MLVIAVTTFDWRSVAPRSLRLMPRSETLVMLVTVVGTLATHNLAVGVVLGVLTAMVAFARRVAHLTRVDVVDRDGERTYRVTGELFWASSNDLVHRFDYAGDPDSVVIDLAGADVWDASTVATLDTVQAKYTARARVCASWASTGRACAVSSSFRPPRLRTERPLVSRMSPFVVVRIRSI